MLSLCTDFGPRAGGTVPRWFGRRLEVSYRTHRACDVALQLTLIAAPLLAPAPFGGAAGRTVSTALGLSGFALGVLYDADKPPRQ